MFSLFITETKLETPRGVCKSCWENEELETHLMELMELDEVNTKKETVRRAYAFNYIKNLRPDLFLRNKNGIMYCKKCDTSYPEYDYSDLQ